MKKMNKMIFIGIVLGMFLGATFIMTASLIAQQAKTSSAPEPPSPPEESTPKFMIIHTVRIHTEADRISIEKFGKNEFLPALKKLQPKGRLGVYLVKASQLKVEDDEYESPADLGIVELWGSAEDAGNFWKNPPAEITNLMSRQDIVSGPIEHKYSFYDVVE